MDLSLLIGSESAPTALGATLLLVLKATAILLLTVGIAACLRRASAGTRHVVWLVAIGSVLALPVLMRWTPLNLRVLPAATVATTTHATDLTGASIDAPITGIEPAPSAGTVDAPASAVRLPSLGTMLAGAWAVVALLLLARLVHGTLAVRRIVRRATPLTDDDWNDRLLEVADRLGIANAPRVVRSDAVHVPFATGIVNATIVLPAECDQWTAGQRDAVLIHELGHVRRRDLLGHTLGRVACALYWFHPLVWTAARRLRDASERACDDLALRLGSRPSEYAEHLLQIVTATGRPAVPSVALAMAQRREFEGRMLAILDPALRRESPARWESASLTGALAVLSLLVAAAAPAPVKSAEPPAEAQSAEVPGLPVIPGTHATTASPKVPVAAATPAATPQPVVNAMRDGEVDIDVGGKVKVKVSDRVQVKIGDMINVNVPLDATTREQMREAMRGERVATQNPDVLARVLRTDSVASVRRVAAWGLQRHVNVPAAQQALRAAAIGDASSDVREMATWALESSRDPGVMGVMADVLRRDTDASVREVAAWALGEWSSPAGTAPLTEQLARETSDEVLATIAWSLGRIVPERAPARLSALLESKSRHTRTLAAWALSNIADPATLPAIRAAIRQPQDATTMRALMRALMRLDASPESLAGMIESSDPTIREVAVEALAGRKRIDPWPWPWPRPMPTP